MDSFSFSSSRAVSFVPVSYDPMSRGRWVYILRSMAQSLNVNGKCGDDANDKPCMQKDNRSENVNNWCGSNRWSANTNDWNETVKPKQNEREKKKRTANESNVEENDGLTSAKEIDAYIKSKRRVEHWAGLKSKMDALQWHAGKVKRKLNNKIDK